MTPEIRLVSKKDSYRLTGESTEIEMANRLLRAIELRGLSRHTIRSYGFDLVNICRWMQGTGRKLKPLTDADLMELIAAHRKTKAAAKTINRRLLVCRILYRYTFNKEIPCAPGVSRPSRHYIGQKYDPYLGIFTVKRAGKLKLSVRDDSKIIEPLTAAQVNELLRLTTRYRDTLIVLLMLLCGLRSHEVLSLRLFNMDLAERSIRIMGKGRKERVLPLPDPIVALTEKYLRHETFGSRLKYALRYSPRRPTWSAHDADRVTEPVSYQTAPRRTPKGQCPPPAAYLWLQHGPRRRQAPCTSKDDGTFPSQNNVSLHPAFRCRHPGRVRPGDGKDSIAI